MFYRVIQGIVGEAILNYKTVEGKRLDELLSKPELIELVNKVTNSLPEYPETIVEQIKENVLDIFQPEELDTYITRYSKKLFTLNITEKDTEESHAMLIFMLLLRHENKGNTSITKQLKEIREFYYSHIINTQEALQAEVKDNPIHGLTRELEDYHIRTTSDIDIIPTRETLTNHLKYLIKF